MKRILACLLTILALTTAVPLAQAETHAYDVDGNGLITSMDALLLSQYYVGKISALPSENFSGNITKVDPLAALMIATGKVSPSTTAQQLYRGTTDETVWVTVDISQIAGTAGETFNLPVYVEAEDSSIAIFDVQKVVYDHTLLSFTDCLIDQGENEPICVTNGDRFQAFYGNPSSAYEEVNLQFTVLQDFAEDTVVDIALQGVSVVVDGDGLRDADIITEAGEVSALVVTREDLEDLVSSAQMLMDPALYTEDSIAVLDAALEAAKAVLDDPLAVQEDFLSAFATISSAIEQLEPLDQEWIIGDVDGDGSVTAADALLTLQAATGKVELDFLQQLLADVDGDEDGQITANDALLILQYTTKKISGFPIEDYM